MHFREEIREFIKNFKNLYTQYWGPVLKGFCKVAPGSTFILALLIGFNLSVFFRDLQYALAVFLSFILSIVLFARIYMKSTASLIREESERIRKLCEIVDSKESENE